MPRLETYVRIVLAGTAIAAVGFLVGRSIERRQTPLAIGILAPTADGGSVAAAVRVAAREIEAEGGVRKRGLTGIAVGTENDPEKAADAAERLVRDREVVGLVVDGPPEVRDAVAAVADRARVALFSVQPAVGIDERAETIELGGLPNQRIVPAASWAMDSLGREVVLVVGQGPMHRLAENLIEDLVRGRGATLVAAYRLGREAATPKDAAAAVVGLARPQATSALVPWTSRWWLGVGSVHRPDPVRPKVVLSCLEGDDAVAFATALRVGGVAVSELPIVHLLLAEESLVGEAARALAGDYLVATTFAADESPRWQEFVREVRAAGATAFVAETADAAYSAVRLLAAAARRVEGFDRDGIRAGVVGSRAAGASRPIAIDPSTRAAWIVPVVARVGTDGVARPIWIDERPSRPRAWPLGRTRDAWRTVVEAEDSAKQEDVR
jgi:urea transport system substrate-binding protein